MFFFSEELFREVVVDAIYLFREVVVDAIYFEQNLNFMSANELTDTLFIYHPMIYNVFKSIIHVNYRFTYMLDPISNFNKRRSGRFKNFNNRIQAFEGFYILIPNKSSLIPIGTNPEYLIPCEIHNLHDAYLMY